MKENEVIQAKQYEKEQADIKHIKEFIASCGCAPSPGHCLAGLGTCYVEAASHLKLYLGP